MMTCNYTDENSHKAPPLDRSHSDQWSRMYHSIWAILPIVFYSSSYSKQCQTNRRNTTNQHHRGG